MSTEARHLRTIRAAIRRSLTKPPTVNSISHDTGLPFTLVQRLVKQHHLNVQWRIQDTLEREASDYCAALEGFKSFCDERDMNFRRAVMEGLRMFRRRFRQN